MKKIIEIRSLDKKILNVSFILTTDCTYKCRYCPKELHEGKSQPVDLNMLGNFFRKYSHRDIVLGITGGEATIHPQFTDLLKLCKSLNVKTKVDTNASRTVSFYDGVAELCDNWCVTMHPSQHTLDLDKIRVLSKKSFTVVYIMMDPEHWQTSLDWFNQIKQIPNIKIILLKAISNWAGANCEVIYTNDQIQFMIENNKQSTFTKERSLELEKTHSWMKAIDTEVTYDDGTIDLLDPYRVVKEEQNRFKGWRCYAGVENISINSDGSISWATCGATHMGYFDTVDLESFNLGIVCPKDECNCNNDIRSSKKRMPISAP
jgi:organic radical activating enzyme